MAVDLPIYEEQAVSDSNILNLLNQITNSIYHARLACDNFKGLNGDVDVIS